MAMPPKVKAFLLCDQAIHAKDGKHSIIGVFQRINAQSFPVFHHRFGIYLRLGELRGSYDLTIRFVDSETENVLAEMQLRGIEHHNPLDDFETSLNLPGIELPKPGSYDIQVLANNELIHIDTLRSERVSKEDLNREPPENGDDKPDFGLGM